jgi:hypothetical protein
MDQSPAAGLPPCIGSGPLPAMKPPSQPCELTWINSATAIGGAEPAATRGRNACRFATPDRDAPV